MSLPIELAQWARRHHVGADALADLANALGMASVRSEGNGSESRVQSQIRLKAPALGMTLWRNNVGVLQDARGVPVRFGLANDSKRLNESFKSGDLIGWRRLTITPAHVGAVVAQFTSIECKPEGWRYAGTEREQAQARWAALVLADGGAATFASKEGDVK